MDLKELKSQAYDAIVQVELWQKKLQEINQLIQQFQQPVTQETTNPDPVPPKPPGNG